MKTRTRYDTLIPYLFSIGKEELVPEKIRRKIPDANKSKWRRMAPERIAHSEMRLKLGELVAKAELQKQLKYYRTALYGMSRAIIMLRPLVAETFLKQKNKIGFKTSVVQSIRQNEPFVPLSNILRRKAKGF